MKLAPDDFELTTLAAYGLLLIACVIGFLGLESFSKAENNLESRLAAAQTELATLSSIRETDHWSDRLVESQAARDALQSQIWTGPTAGVIAAELQQALRMMAGELKFDQLQIRVDPDPVESDGVMQLSYEMSGRAPSSKDFADFFEAIATYPKILVVDEFDFAQSLRDRRPPRLGMRGRIAVQIAAPNSNPNSQAGNRP